MPVHSTLNGHNRKTALRTGVGLAALAVTPLIWSAGFATPTGQSVFQRRNDAVLGDGSACGELAQQVRGISTTSEITSLSASMLAGAAIGIAGAVSAASSTTRSSKVHAVRAALAPKSPQSIKATLEDEGALDRLADLLSELMEKPDSVDDAFVRRIQEFATREFRFGGELQSLTQGILREIAKSADGVLSAPIDQRIRWATSSMASILLTFTVMLQPAHAVDKVTYSDFLAEVQSGNVEIIRVSNDRLTALYTTKDGQAQRVNLVPNSTVQDALFGRLMEKKIDVVLRGGDAAVDAGAGIVPPALAKWAAPVAWLLTGLLLLFGGASPLTGNAGGKGKNLFATGKSTARLITDGDTKVKFADVAGCDRAKEELVEVVDFLKNPAKYREVGAKIPKGALLVGPPGTGKTMLAKAVAGEAGVPFWSVSAAEFVEVYAGVGASRVRDLFTQAKENTPCIIFIDEIDAVGRQRSAGFGQGNDEREQTVNQLLTEMDGFQPNNGVVVLAATNRADVLDKALVRPGRFDRQIQVDAPDFAGRVQILRVHAKDRKLAKDVDLESVARQTPGMTGADLQNLLNESAITAARQNKQEVNTDDIFNALERIIIGLEKKDGVMSERKKRLVAYHEAGHAILGAMMDDYDMVSKISIVPRGPTGGVTIFSPSEERLNSGLYSKQFLENRMCVCLGGRIAEELLNGEDNVTTGASNDFQQCTSVARAMVSQLGMSDLIGQRVVGASSSGGGGPFMGRDFMGGGAPPVSQKLRQDVDKEIKYVVEAQYARGMHILKSNRSLLDAVSEQLIEQEKMNGDELLAMITEHHASGKLVVEKVMAMAGFIGERRGIIRPAGPAPLVATPAAPRARPASPRARPVSRRVPSPVRS